MIRSGYLPISTPRNGAAARSRDTLRSRVSLLGEKSIHAIPVLVLICFLTLWWFSHPAVNLEIKDGRFVDVHDQIEPKMLVHLEQTQIGVAMLTSNSSLDASVPQNIKDAEGSESHNNLGPDLVIHQSKECLDKMGEWCQSHHAASGLTKKVIHSTVTEREAELQVIEFVRKHVGTHTPLLAGNSVYNDFIFLKEYMPELASLFSHVLVDVSSVKALCIRWYPGWMRDGTKFSSI